MRILHTSDWHLGHRLHEQSQFEEQQLFLNWLIDFINAKHVDLLLISGDVFDTGAPSAQSLGMYYDFLMNLKTTPCQHVLITGGNHDAPGTLNAPKEILRALNIIVVGKATENIEDEVFQLGAGDEKVILAAVPYLRDQDIRKAVAGESFTEIGDRYKSALIKHYKEVAEHCQKINTGGHPLMAMGHLFAVGGSTSDSEQTIYVGNAGDIGADDFPAVFDYIALGHLHRCQSITPEIRYSGSPYILSFSEILHEKKVLTIDVTDKSVVGIESHVVPPFRMISRIKGSLDACISELSTLASSKHTLTPWVEVVLDTDDTSGLSFTDIYNAVDGLDIKVLKVSLSKEQEKWNLLLSGPVERDVKDYTPEEVFQLKCEEQNFDLELNPEIKDAFHEILQIAKKQ